MKCIIGGQALGSWCRVIHTLVQVGDDEIFFDFAETIMTISTTNSSLSTFSSFMLFRPFFTHYSMTSEQPEKVAIPAKIILKPYRTQRMAKNHVTSEIQYNPNEDHITITSEGKSKASTTYRLGASVHNEEIQFDCDPHAYRNCLKVDAKVLANCLSNFSHMKGLSELTLKVQGQRVMLRNTVTDVTRKDGSVVTEFNLTAHDFIDFEVEDDNIEFAFGFREFKLYTTFAEQLKLPVHIHFQTAADPVIITVRNDTFEARLCMATRLGDPFDSLIPTPTSSAGSTNGRISNVTSQSSGTSIQNGTTGSAVAQEVNRNRQTASRTATTSAVNNPEPPPAKRLRRTEAAPPVAELSRSRVPADNDNNDDGAEVEVLQPDDQSLAPEIDQPNDDPPGEPSMWLEGAVEAVAAKRTCSAAAQVINRILARPRRSEAEYLASIPGHDIILCPDSDEDA